MPVHKNTTRAFQKGYKPTCLCTKAGHRGQTFGPKRLKTHVYSDKKLPTSGREAPENLPRGFAAQWGDGGTKKSESNTPG